MARSVALALLAAGVLVLLGSDTAAQVTPEYEPPSPFGTERPVPLQGNDPRWPEVQGWGICSTSYGWCPLAYPQEVPQGAPCYCVTETRVYVTGLTASRPYWGHVNPYFNPWK
jgi:hypothetical protein